MKRILILFAFLLNISAEENGEYLIPLDGSNAVLFNMEYPENSANRLSTIYGNPLDDYPYDFFPILQNPISSDIMEPDTLHKLELYGSLTSETGEMMLNQFTGASDENRDHATNLGIVWKPKNSSLKFFYTQRYLDTYSDRYDKIWREYRDDNEKSMFSDGEGLVHDYLLGYLFENKKVTSGFALSSYGYWGATPVFFSPIYKKGYLFSPVLLFNLNSSKLTMSGDIDINSEYQDHQEGIDYNDAKCDISWYKPFGKSASLKLKYYRDTKMTAVWKLGSELTDTLDGVYNLNIAANVYGSLKPEIFLKFNLTRIPKIVLSAEGALEYHEKLRGYKFIEKSDTVSYKSYDYFEPQFHVSASYHDTLFFPANLKIWYDYSFKRSWESAEWFDGYKINVMRDTINDNPVNGLFGIKGDYKITYKFLNVNLWGGLTITPKNKNMQYSLPYNLGVDIEFGKSDSTGLFGGLYFNTREQMVYKYYNVTEATVKEAIAPARTSLSLKARVPFKLPVLREKLKTAVEVEAGPIRFAKEQRLAEHPMGNDYGPSISVAIRAALN